MKTMWTRCIAGAAALALGCGVQAAASRSSGPGAALEVSTLVPALGAAPAAQMPVDCLRAFSKDYCDSFMDRGEATIAGCPFLPTPCTTVTVANATMVLPLQRNQQLCGSSFVAGKCDESPQTDGTLKASMRYEVRLNDPCPFRGCWSAKWELGTVTGARYEGEAMGTIGVGTNRPFTCPEHRTSFCEKCLDVQFIPTPIGGLWRIGFEGAFQGKRTDVPNGERLCFTVNADWYLEGDSSGPFDWSGDFKIKGTADGIHAVPCGF